MISGLVAAINSCVKSRSTRLATQNSPDHLSASHPFSDSQLDRTRLPVPRKILSVLHVNSLQRVLHLFDILIFLHLFRVTTRDKDWKSTNFTSSPMVYGSAPAPERESFSGPRSRRYEATPAGLRELLVAGTRGAGMVGKAVPPILPGLSGEAGALLLVALVCPFLAHACRRRGATRG